MQNLEWVTLQGTTVGVAAIGFLADGTIGSWYWDNDPNLTEEGQIIGLTGPFEITRMQVLDDVTESVEQRRRWVH